MSILSNAADSSTINRTEAAKALMTELRERFPALADFQPLKLLVHLEVRAALEGVPHIRIADALGWHINSPRYQKALSRGGPRYNLAGEVAGEVTPEQQRLATERLKAMREKRPKRPPPQPVPTPPPTASVPKTDALGRPILRLKPKASTVTAAAVTRRELRP